MKFVLDILRGAVIGIANLIPGVSGGTMMVSMGIYDTLIDSITNLFRRFRKSVLTLLPYLIGMLLAIGLGSFGLKAAFENYPLPTNMLFIGMILGSVPMIRSEMEGERTGRTGAVIFILFFALVVGLKAVEGNNTAALGTGALDLVLYFVLGAISSSTMVIPGVSGSMILKTLGYYEPIVTQTIPALLTALRAGDGAVIGHSLLILVPFGLGIVVGIFAIAKLISVLLRRWKGWTYCAILGMVLASPVAILMEPTIYEGAGLLMIGIGTVLMLLGCWMAGKLGGEPASAKS